MAIDTELVRFLAAMNRDVRLSGRRMFGPAKISR